MELLGTILFAAGCAGLFAGYIWSLRLAFRKSTPFGVACLLVPVLLLYHLTTCPAKTWRPVLLLACSLAVFVGGVQLTKP